MIFTLKIGTIEINPKSRIIVMFPYYYTPMLSRDGVVRCFMGDENVNCKITKERVLEVMHFKTIVPTATEMSMRIVGVTQAYNY